MIAKGMRLPSIPLVASSGGYVDLSSLQGIGVVYAYPRTSPPDSPPLEGWDQIPGARGCTRQSCAFRDHHAELAGAGARFVFGLSTQTTAYQSEAAERLHLPFALLSDAELRLARALGLPTFSAGGMTLLKRLTFIFCNGYVEQVMFPVEDPGRNAQEVLVRLGRLKGQAYS